MNNNQRIKEIKKLVNFCEKTEFKNSVEDYYKDYIFRVNKWQRENPEKQCLAVRKYEKTQKGRISRAKTNAFRNQRIKHLISALTAEQKKQIQEFYLNCPRGYEVDHIIPISRGGKHILSNFQYLTKEENRRKGCKLDYKINTQNKENTWQHLQ